jgi:hypothetical protein
MVLILLRVLIPKRANGLRVEQALVPKRHQGRQDHSDRLTLEFLRQISPTVKRRVRLSIAHSIGNYSQMQQKAKDLFNFVGLFLTALLL